MPVVAIGHINLRTPLFDETMAFYESVLGLRPDDARTMADKVNNGWLHAADGRPIIHVNKTRPGEDIAAITPGRLDHVALDCDDMNGMEARLTAEGVPYQKRAFDIPGLFQLNLHDPNGLKIELTFGHEAVRRT